MKKILLTIIILCSIARFCCATTFESQLLFPELLNSLYGAEYYGQTFTPTTTHNSIGIKVSLGASATRLYNLNAYLCDTLSQKPIVSCLGNYIAKGTIYASSVNRVLGSGLEYHIIFNNVSEKDLATNTLYSLVMVGYGTSDTPLTVWGKTGNPYVSGSAVFSKNAGLTWTTTTDDLYFQIIGELPCPATSLEDMCVCTTTLSYISNTSTGAGFWLDSSISLGDFLIASFLLGILILFIVKFIFELEIPRKINFKKI